LEVVTMSKYPEISKSTPTAAAAALVDKIIAYLDRTHADHPEIPINVLWADLKRDIEAATNNQAEG
jgi:hypothetical protein